MSKHGAIEAPHLYRGVAGGYKLFGQIAGRVNRCPVILPFSRLADVAVHDVDALNGASHTGSDQADRLEWSDTVDRALARLAPEYREAFLLKHVDDLEYVVESDPDFREASANLGVVYLSLGRFEEALAIFRSLLAAQPDSAQYHYHLAVALNGQGEESSAAREYQACLACADPQSEIHAQATSALASLAARSVVGVRIQST